MGAAIPIAMGAEAVLGYMGARSQNAANAQQAQQQMQFQAAMSGTAYQRAVADMKAAGLNPALAYQQGGASTPGGAQATMQNTLAGLKGTAQGAAQSIATMRANAADVANKQAQTENVKAQTQQLQLESLDRALSWSLGNRLTATNARFNEDTFDFRKQALAQQNVLADTEIKRSNLAYQMEDKFREQLFNQQVQLFPLQQELLRQNIANTAVHARETAANAALLELKRPGAENVAASDKTLWGRQVRPYLNDAKSTADLLGKGAGVASNFLPGGSVSGTLLRQLLTRKR